MKKLYVALAVVLSLIVSQASATDYYLKSGGGLITATNQWGPNLDGSGTSPSNFNGAHVWHFTNRTGVSFNTTPSAFGIAAAATMSIHSGFNFTITGNGTFQNAFAIDIASGGTLTIQKSTNLQFNNLDANSTVIFNTSNYTFRASSNYQSSLTYGNVVINAVNGIQGTGNTIFIAGKLTIAAGQTFSVSGNTVFFQGTGGSVAGTGSLIADASSVLAFNGGSGGNNGDLIFTSTGNHLQTLSVDYNSGSDLITLQSDVFIENTGFFVHNRGILDLNGNSVFVDATSDAAFPATSADGEIIGDAASELQFSGTTGLGTGFTTMYMSATDNNLKSLVFNCPGNFLTIGSALVINDSLSVLDGSFDTGNLVSISAPAGGPKARVSRVGGSGAINGDLTVNTVISGGLSGTGWNLLGAPVGGQTVASWDTYATNGGTSGLPMTCNNCFYAPTALSPSFASIQGWVESSGSGAYNDQVDASDPLTSGVGFWVYVGNGPTDTDDMTIINTGPVAQGAVGVPMSTSGSDANHWNLVANPFPSPISWEDVHAVTESIFPGSVNAEAHVYSPEVGYSSWVAGVGGTGNMIDDILAMAQGFYVTCNTGAVNLVFDESCKVDDQTTEIQRTSASKNTNREYVKIKIDGAYGKDETMINFNNSATSTFDRLYDGHKIFVTAGYQGYGNSYSKYTTISTQGADGTDYSINSLPLRTSSLTIPVLARVMVTGSHTISISSKENFESCLILHDKLAGKFHDLNSGPYVFDISDTTSTPRFDLIMCQSESGPVVSVQELQKKEQVFINQDAQGAFVRTSFDQRTKATISAFNIVGQQVMSDVTVDGTETLTRLNLANMSNQVVIIRVTSEQGTVVKKIIAH